MSKKKNGFTIIEITVTTSILMILIYAIQLGYSSYKENLLLTEAATKIVTTISMYRDKAYYENVNYTLSFEILDKKILIKDTKTFSAEIKIPAEPFYKIISTDVSTSKLTTTIYQTGNLSKAFSLYIFNSKKIAKYRISFYIFSQLKFLSINLYKNLSDGQATYDNIENYHKVLNVTGNNKWTKE
ncbi:MAG: pilus assembly FimT family protein [Fusobacteriaceae bacterium]